MEVKRIFAPGKAIPALFLIFAFGYPVIAFLDQAGSSGNGSKDLPRVLSLLCFTAFLGIGSALLSLILGAPFGYLLTQIANKRRKWLEIVATIPFLLPPLLVAMGFSWYRNHSWIKNVPTLALVFIAQSVMNFGLVGRVFAGALTALPHEQRENAAVDGLGWFASLMRIQVPQVRTAISHVLLVVALYCSTSYGLVLILGAGSINTLETEISVKALEELNLHQSALLAGAQTLLTLLYFLAARKTFAITQGEFTQPDFVSRLGAHGIALVLLRIWSGLLVCVVGGLLSAPFLSSFQSESGWNLSGYRGLFGRGARDLLNISVFQATENSVRNLLVALVIAGPVAWFTAGAKNRYLDFATILPLGLSAVVLGLGYLIGFGSSFLSLRENWLIVPLAQSVVMLPLLHQILTPARRGLHPAILEAAELDGVGSFGRTWWIEFPILRRNITTALGFGALVSLGEFGAASFLAYGDQATLPVLMFRLASRPGSGNFEIAMAAASFFIAITAVVLFLTNRENSRYE